MRKRWSIGVVILGLVLASAGCSSSRKGGTTQEPGAPDELREVGTMLVLMSGELGRGYTKPGDLANYETGCPLGHRAVVSGAIVIVPGATMPGEGEKGGTTAIVAYEQNTPAQGGFVLLHNSTIKKMTADEFRSAPKFGG